MESLLARIDAWSLSWGDRLPPLLVRSVRQDLRSKQFLAIYILLLLISALVALVVAATANTGDDNTDQAAGRNLYIGIGWCWSFVLLVIQASAQHGLVAQERQDDTWDLVQLTGLTPRRVLTGLLATGLVRTGLITAAMAPFLVMAYLLRGIDLPSILLALVCTVLAAVLASCVGLFAACATPAKKAKAGAAGTGLLAALGWMILSAFLFTDPRMGSAFAGELVRWDKGAWTVAILVLTAWACGCYLLLVFSGALLTHRADDRSTAPRRAVTRVWLVSILCFIVGSLIHAGGPRDWAESIAVLGCGTSMLAIIAAFFAITEDWELTPRQARALTASGWRGWSQRLCFGPGAVRGHRWILVLYLAGMAFTCLGAWLEDSLGGSTVEEFLLFGWISPGVAIAAMLACDALVRWAFARMVQGPPARRLLMTMFLSVWAIIPVIIALFASKDSVAQIALMLSSPLGAIIRLADVALDGLLITGEVITPCVVLWLVLRSVERNRVVNRVHAGGTDHNPRA